MTNPKNLLFILIQLVFVAQLQAQQTVSLSNFEKPDPAWFGELRFGMFIHFGLYSIPAGEWEGERMGRNWYAEWIRMQQSFPEYNEQGGVGIPKEEYDTLLERFNPVNFDADEWIRMASEAGMKYFLITSKHHDGFALWPTEVSTYDVVDATPFNRDILGDLAAACEKYGLALGFYYSHWQDWGHPGGARPPWPTGRKQFAKEPVVEQPSDEAFESYWQSITLPQVEELIDRYDPDFLWFDNWKQADLLTEARLNELIALVRRKDPEILINSRIGTTWNHPDGDIYVDFLSSGDNEFPDERIPRVWETSGTMQRSWGYHKLDPVWKPVRQLLRHLVDNASRGGNYQLNVGPMGDGSFPEPAIRRLREIGSWMDINGEAVYATEPVNLPEFAWGRLTGKATAEGYRIYVHVYEWPDNRSLTIPALDVEPNAAFLLETGFPVETGGGKLGLEMKLPASLPPDERISVIALDFAANPAPAED